MTDSINKNFNEASQITAQKPLIKWTWLRLILFVVFNIIFLIAVIMIVNLKPDIFGVSSGISEFTYGKFLEFISALLAIIFCRKYFDRKSFMSIGIKFEAKDFLVGLTLGALPIVLGFTILYFLGFIEVTNLQFNSSKLSIWFMTFILVALHEEFVCRGYILNNLLTSNNKFVALTISSLLFALIHIANAHMGVIPFINLTLAGYVLGIYYCYHKNLWLPIGLHLTWNFFQGPIMGFNVSGIDTTPLITQHISGNQLITGGSFGFEGSLLCTFFCLILIYIQYRMYSNSENE